MSQISITGASTGTATFTLESPATSTNRTLILPDNTGTIITQNSTPAFASTIGVGGATAAASGAGITFPATQSASSDANTLDDYEEGTWEATLTCSSSGTITIATENLCSYTKIGRLVHLCGQLQTTAVSSPVGYINLNGFPFAVANRTSPDFETRAAPSLYLDGVTSANVSDFLGLTFENQTLMRIYLGDATSAQADSAQQMQVGVTIIFSLTYRAA
jgi:hypothetical protein